MAGSIPNLNAGDTIKGGRYGVLKKLGEGGFGAVYTVKDKNTGRTHAMKIEGVSDPIQILKMEVVVLNACMERQGGRHVCKIIDKGRNNAFNYIIMTLVGQSLADLRGACPGQKFSLGTAFRIGIQCMEALEDLHNIGYLHRDVKPGNFAVGREEDNDVRTVYVLDFGMCRKYVKEGEQRVRKPREAAGFRGTLQYAAMNCHNFKELGRKDDLESWFYQQVQITVGKLPWANVKGASQSEETKLVGDYKRNCRGVGGELLRGTPAQYPTILQYVDRMTYYDRPDYQLVYGQLRQAMQAINCQDKDPFDWEKGGQHRQQTQMLPAPYRF